MRKHYAKVSRRERSFIFKKTSISDAKQGYVPKIKRALRRYRKAKLNAINLL